jgi:cytochrome c-type biogenesis protein CcmE
MYRISNRRQLQRRNRSRFWLAFALVFVAVAIFGLTQFLKSLHQAPVVTQSKAVVTKVSYKGKTKHYLQPDFSIDIPIEWKLQPREPNTYQVFTWDVVDRADNISIAVYEDTIPTNFAVNKALVINGQTNHIELTGQVSDNCIKYTIDGNTQVVNGLQGVRAKWQNVDFLCNRATTTRDVTGTSSTDGINTVILKKADGSSHKFFFTYSANQIDPNYTIFYNALSTFSMR